MTKFVIVAVLSACLGLAAEASTCRVVRSRVVVQEVAVAQVVAAVFTPIAVTVPSYSVGQPYQQDLTPLLEELRAMRQEIQQLRLGQANGGASKTEPAFVATIRANCAACHGVTPRGNKLSLFHPDGAWKEPTPELLGDIIAQVSSGRMPKERKMAAEDRLSLIAGLTSAPPQANAEKLKEPTKQP